MIRLLIGLVMRAYRRSPLCPRMGKMLAGVLGVATDLWYGRTVVRQVNGVYYDLDLREVIDASLYFSGVFERETERVIEQLLRPGMVALDIGANIGCHTFSMARRVGGEGRVIAVEPTKWAFRRLKRNAALNSFTNIAFLNIGLSDSEHGLVEGSVQASYRLDGTSQFFREEMLIRTLDSVVKELRLERVDFIKLDVDGFEGKVFKGATETLRRFRPHLVFEVYPAGIKQCGEQETALICLLRSFGYVLKAESGEEIAHPLRYLGSIPSGCSVNFLATAASGENGQGDTA